MERQPQTIQELQAFLIKGFARAAILQDRVYDVRATEIALCASTDFIFRTLGRMDDETLIKEVRKLAGTVIEISPSTINLLNSQTPP